MSRDAVAALVAPALPAFRDARAASARQPAPILVGRRTVETVGDADMREARLQSRTRARDAVIRFALHGATVNSLRDDLDSPANPRADLDSRTGRRHGDPGIAETMTSIKPHSGKVMDDGRASVVGLGEGAMPRVLITGAKMLRYLSAMALRAGRIRRRGAAAADAVSLGRCLGGGIGVARGTLCALPDPAGKRAP